LVNEQLTEHFRQKWADFDPEGTAFVKVWMLHDLLFALDKPLGWHEQDYINNLKK